MKAIYKYDGPLGTYALEEQNGLLTRLWLGNRMALLPGETEISETPLLKEAHRQLTAYFAREQKQFDLPIAPEGTPFQLKIWKLLQEIPCHRVIGSGGKLTGYTGGLNIKIGLLQIEGALDLSLWPESPNY